MVDLCINKISAQFHKTYVDIGVIYVAIGVIYVAIGVLPQVLPLGA